MKNIIVLLVLFLMSGSLWASRLEIDTSAYACWQRVDDYSISKNGLWVKYRYVSVGRESEDMGKCYYFYNTRTEKTKILKGIEYPEFFANGDWIYYTENNEITKKNYALFEYYYQLCKKAQQTEKEEKIQNQLKDFRELIYLKSSLS